MSCRRSHLQGVGSERVRCSFIRSARCCWPGVWEIAALPPSEPRKASRSPASESPTPTQAGLPRGAPRGSRGLARAPRGYSAALRRGFWREPCRSPVEPCGAALARRYSVADPRGSPARGSPAGGTVTRRYNFVTTHLTRIECLSRFFVDRSHLQGLGSMGGRWLSLSLVR